MASTIKVDQFQSDSGTVNVSSNLQFSSGFSLNTPTITGQATIPTINLTGGQIKFPATQSASSDANTLDDYEEGTWTPRPAGTTTAGNWTPVDVWGEYIKIGRQVTVSCYVYGTGFTGTGDFTLTGLPFTIKGIACGAMEVNSNPFGNLKTGGSMITAMFFSDETRIYFRATDTDSNDSYNQLQCSTSGVEYLRISCTYFVY